MFLDIFETVLIKNKNWVIKLKPLYQLIVLSIHKLITHKLKLVTAIIIRLYKYIIYLTMILYTYVVSLMYLILTRRYYVMLTKIWCNEIWVYNFIISNRH